MTNSNTNHNQQLELYYYLTYDFMLETYGCVPAVLYAVVRQFTIHGDKHHFFGTVATLARMSGTNVKATRRAIKLLIENEYVIDRRRHQNVNHRLVVTGKADKLARKHMVTRDLWRAEYQRKVTTAK